MTLPSRKAKGHKKAEQDINELVGSTISQFSALDYVPVYYISHALDLVELCALYSFADVLLVTSLMEGMGTVVCEFYYFLLFV